MAKESKQLSPKQTTPLEFFGLSASKIQEMGFVEVELSEQMQGKAYQYAQTTPQGKHYSKTDTCDTEDNSLPGLTRKPDLHAKFRTALHFGDSIIPGSTYQPIRLAQAYFPKSYQNFGQQLIAQLKQTESEPPLSKEEAQALFLFASKTGNTWTQAGQYGFLHALISYLFHPEKSIAPYGVPDGSTVSSRQGASCYKIDKHDDGSIKISVLNMLDIKNPTQKPTPLLYHRSEFLLKPGPGVEKADSFPYILTLQKTQVFVRKGHLIEHQLTHFFSDDNRYGHTIKASTRLAKKETYSKANRSAFEKDYLLKAKSLSEIRAITLNTPALPPHWMSRVLGTLIGLVMGVLTSPIIYTSLALEDMARNKPMHFLKRLGKLMLTVLLSPLAPLIGAAYGAESGFNTGLSYAISPKSHFKFWLSHSLKHRKGEARINYWKAHKDHDPAYTVLTISALLAGGVFAVLFFEVITPPIFVLLLEWLTLPVLPVSIALVGVGFILLLGVSVALYQHAHFQPEPDYAVQLETLKASNAANFPASPAEVKTPAAKKSTVNTTLTGTPEPAQGQTPSSTGN